jgi:hypothetical protein
MAISDNGTIYVVWFEGTERILFKRSIDGGTTFSADAVTLFGSTGCSNHLVVSASKNNIYAACEFENTEVFEGTTPGTHGMFDYSLILYTGSTDYGATFSDASSLTKKQDENNGGINLFAEHPHIISVGDDAYIVYTMRHSGVLSIRISDNQTKFHEPVLISNNTRSSDFNIASLKAARDNVYISYIDRPSNGTLGEILFLAASVDKGTTFQQPLILSQNNTGLSSTGSDTAVSSDDNNNLHVIWLTSDKDIKNTLQYARVFNDSGRSVTLPAPNSEKSDKDSMLSNETKQPTDETRPANQVKQQQNTSPPSSAPPSTGAQSLVDSGNDLYDKGDYAGALAQYEKAIQTDPDNAVLWSYKGLALDHLGKYQEAIEAFEKAIAIDPNYEQAKENRAKVLAASSHTSQ